MLRVKSVDDSYEIEYNDELVETVPGDHEIFKRTTIFFNLRENENEVYYLSGKLINKIDADELKHFLHCVNGRGQSRYTMDMALKLLKMYSEFRVAKADQDIYNFFEQMIKHLTRGRTIFRQQKKQETIIFNCDLDVFYNFINIIDGIVSELVRFKLVHKYCFYHKLDADDISTKILNSCIDYSKMSPMEFLNGPGHSDILTDQEKYIILSKICLKS